MKILVRSTRTAVVFVIAAAMAAGCASSAGDAPPEAAATAVAPVAVELGPSEMSNVQGVAMGREDAPVVIYEFADFQCPGCAQFAEVVTPFIKERYVDPGSVRYIYYDFPLTSIHPHAFLAARAGRCADEQGRFWEYHDLLYQRQRDWGAVEDAAGSFLRYAGQVGLDSATFESCLRSDRYAEEVSRTMKLGEYLGVPGTPTLFVNGKRIEVRSLEDLDRTIQQELGTTPGAN